MEFVVGRTVATGAAQERKTEPGAPIEARVLHVRAPRRRQNPMQQHSEERAAGSAVIDPPGARVLVLLVADAHRLPEDLMDGPYRIFLRVTRR